MVVEVDTNNNGTVDDAADQAYTLLNDERGTPMGIMDKSGTLVELLFYNSTGLVKPYQPGTGTGQITRAGQDWVPAENGYGLPIYQSAYVRIGWTGLYRDPFTGKYHAHLRDYDPLQARWPSEDPMGYQDGLNLYAAYMGLEARDPTGANEEQANSLAKVGGWWKKFDPVGFALPRPVTMIVNGIRDQMLDRTESAFRYGTDNVFSAAYQGAGSTVYENIPLVGSGTILIQGDTIDAESGALRNLTGFEKGLHAVVVVADGFSLGLSGTGLSGTVFL